MAPMCQRGDFAILSIFPEIDMDFCFNEDYFMPTIFFIVGQVGYARKIYQNPCFISPNFRKNSHSFSEKYVANFS